MAYALESISEAERLETQSTQRAYSLADELRYVSIQQGDRILDAGCGTGVLSRYLRSTHKSDLEIEGCDISQTRILEAEKMSTGNTISYFQSDLSHINRPDAFYSRIFSRYVFQHLENPIAVAQELYRLLRPQGYIHIIETDGLFFNIYSGNSELEESLTAIKNHPGLGFDLFVGRKLPYILNTAGFKNIEWNIIPMTFSGNELKMEQENFVHRFKIIRPLLSNILGESEADSFVSLYLSEMMKEETVLFFNKMIVTASKE